MNIHLLWGVNLHLRSDFQLQARHLGLASFGCHEVQLVLVVETLADIGEIRLKSYRVAVPLPIAFAAGRICEFRHEALAGKRCVVGTVSESRVTPVDGVDDEMRADGI